MRFLVDACAGSALARALREDGHDVVDILEGSSLEESDTEILKRAANERRILITIDKDFGELIFLHRQSHAGLIRLPDRRVAERLAVLRQILRTHGEDLASGAIVTVRGGRARVTHPTDVGEE